MDKNNLSEALYALPGGVVVRRKKSPVLSLVVLAIGIGLIVLYFFTKDTMGDNLASSLIMAAGAVTLVGGLMLTSCLVDTEGRPVIQATGERLRYKELYFPQEQRAEVQRLIDEGSVKRILATTSSQSSSIAVAIFYSAELHVVSMQAYEYIGYEYRPITGIKVIADR